MTVPERRRRRAGDSRRTLRAVVVEGRSTLVAGWWKVRSTSAGWSRTIEEVTLHGEYRPEPVDNASQLGHGNVAD